MQPSSLDHLPSLREVIARYELMAKKSLGQHFLLDLNLTRMIAEMAGDLTGVTVFEIGPGPGGLTRALVESNAKQIIAIEKDRRCIAALADLVTALGGRLHLSEGDALESNLATLAPAPRAIVANLPYNIGTELLVRWLHQIDQFQSLTIMLQAEVVDRIVAEPGSKTYGRLSIISQFCCEPQARLDVPAAAFTPPPKVDSSVLHLTPRKDRPADVPLSVLEKVTAAAFGQRRKMLRSSLRALGGEDLLRRAGIDPELRAERLSVKDFENLTRVLINA